MHPTTRRAADGIAAVLLGVLLGAAAGPTAADHGDPSTRPNPIPPAYIPDVPLAVNTLKQDNLVLTLTVSPPTPKSGELVRLALNIHDPEQARDFQGDVKVVVTDGSGTEIASGSALTDEGEASYLLLLGSGGSVRVRFEFDADIPAWTPTRVKRPGPSTPPLAVGADGKGKVWLEFAAEESSGALPIPMPWAIGGGVVLLLAAIVFLRKRS